MYYNFSDGCGRTGTYCLVDMVLNRMAKGAKEIDIAATLEHIRDQRMDTVKTKVTCKIKVKLMLGSKFNLLIWDLIHSL